MTPRRVMLRASLLVCGIVAACGEPDREAPAAAARPLFEGPLVLPHEGDQPWPHSPPAAVAPEGDRLALVLPGPRLVIVDVDARRVRYETSLRLRTGESSRVTVVGWSAGGERLVVQYSTGEAQVLDARTGSLERELTSRVGAAPARGWSRRAAAWIDDELLLATHGDGPFELWCVECDERVRAFEPLGGPTSAFALSPDRELLAVGDHSGGVVVWRVRDGQLVGRAPSEGVRVNGLAFDARGARLAVALHSVEAVVWSLEDWSEVARVSHEDQNVFGDLEVGRVALSPSGRLLATTTSPFWEVRVWGLEDGRERWRYDYRGGNPGFMSADFSDDGRRVLMGLRGVVADARTGAIQATLAPSNDVYTWVRASGDLAWIYYDGCLRVWSLADPALTPRDIEIPFEGR